jgi:Transposase
LLLKHKGALFTHLTERWKDLFNAKFEILLYDLTSTYFECDPPIEEADKRKFGHSRDKRSDCVQVVIALIVTPEGFPLAYEVLAGNTSDKTTLRDFLKKIEVQYGKAERTWVLDRGIPTEEVLAEMRNSEPSIYYLVGTPKSRLSKLEAELIGRPWEQVRPGLDVKLLAHEGELYVQAQSQDRVSKERAMRRRRLRKLWNRLCELQKMKLNTKALLIKIGEAKKEAGRAFGLIDLKLPNPGGRKRESRKRKGRQRKSPKLNLTLVSELTAPSFAKPTGAKANTCCGATLLSKPQPRFGNITPSSRKSRKPSKI